MDTLETIFKDIQKDPQNEVYTKANIAPLYAAPKTARINIVGQAPGLKAQDTRMYWNDKSGDRLRDWMGVTRDEFYNSGLFAILPMDFYFPGKGKSGDLPPRKGFAEKWHPKILSELPDIRLTLLIGRYAMKYYLPMKAGDTLTAAVKNYKAYLPEYFPIVHPSPRNQLWLSKNPWFKETVLPDLKHVVRAVLDGK